MKEEKGFAILSMFLECLEEGDGPGTLAGPLESEEDLGGGVLFPPWPPSLLSQLCLFCFYMFY